MPHSAPQPPCPGAPAWRGAAGHGMKAPNTFNHGVPEVDKAVIVADTAQNSQSAAMVIFAFLVLMALGSAASK